ncbi:o-antigen polymerase [Burkholderiales bacterium GJ-E10]|nr:o-antigen polymerase [Burkholderiales bacterium GJ-E10]
MRDIALLALLAALLPKSLMHPWVGSVVWAWISLMNPHEYTWTARHFPVAATVGGATLLGLVFSRDRKRSPFRPATWVLCIFLLWICLTTAVAFYPAESWDMLKKVLKIQLMVFVTIAVLTNRRQLDIFLWVVVFSIGYYGVKGGLFTIATGGSYRVWGPPNSFIEGNNELALALVMTIPLMRYLQLGLKNAWQRNGMTVAMVLTAAAALGSQSRGALLAISAMGLLLWWRSPRKLVSGVVIAGCAVGLFFFMPESWHQRMDTIGTYHSDESAMGRIYTWRAMTNLAEDRVTGGGFAIYRPEIFAQYKHSEDTALVRAAHSIYFQVLGEHGFIGLGIFLLFWMVVWGTAARLRRRARGDPRTRWAADLAALSQAALIGYWVGGAFLSLAYFDLPYDLVAALVVAGRIVDDTLAERPTPVASGVAVAA